jgi:6,7-dimethyl-8-ribityllumazine synthase
VTRREAAPALAPDAAKGLKIAIVAARFNAHITEKLVDGALDVLDKAGAKRKAVLWVPGALELPLAALMVIREKKPDAVVCIGCVIEGDSDHYLHVSTAASQGVARVSLDTGVVVTNAILTVKTEQQAQDRAGGKVGNKGAEAAVAAIETVRAFEQLE